MHHGYQNINCKESSYRHGGLYCYSFVQNVLIFITILQEEEDKK